jgi:hypothetical protein
MRSYLLLLLIMAFFSSWLRADVYKEQRTGIEFPETIGTYRRGKATPYEAEPGKAGVAIEYRAEDAEVTIYVRALGNEARKTSAEFLKDSLAGVKALEAQGKYSNVKIYEFSSDKEKPGWKSAAFTSSSTNRFLISFIYCTVASGHFVKIRATSGNPKNELLQSFTKSLQEIVDHASKKP